MDDPGHPSDRHLGHEQQSESFKSPSEMLAEAFPGWLDPMNLSAGLTPSPRQSAVDLAAVLKDIEMSPNQFLGMIITADLPPIMRAPATRPELRCFTDVEGDQTGLVVEVTISYFPFGA